MRQQTLPPCFVQIRRQVGKGYPVEDLAEMLKELSREGYYYKQVVFYSQQYLERNLRQESAAGRYILPPTEFPAFEARGDSGYNGGPDPSPTYIGYV
jgi:hypothetical protein